MTATTNGASLEDCLTNIFSLIDLNGIRWKRFRQKENNNYLYTPIDTHPVLTTYARCIEENHIAVWRHEPQRRYSSGPAGHNGGGSSSAGHSNLPTPTRTSNNNTPTSAGPNATLSSGSGNQQNNGGTNSSVGGGNSNNTNPNGPNNNSYELWIFGYGNQLKVDDVIGDDLVEIEDDTWEARGLSYEFRTLLFKALHNLIDRCLTSKGFTRIGRWFVQPIADNLNHSACCHNAINIDNHYPATLRHTKHLRTEQFSSINPMTSSSPSSKSTSNPNLFNTISSSINNFFDYHATEKCDSRQCLDRSDGLRHRSTRSSNSYFTTSLDGTKSSLSFAFSFFVHGDSNICTTVDVRQHPLVHPLTVADMLACQSGGIVRVALAPYGLNGILNGVSYKDSDNGAATTAFIQQWTKFHPLPKTLARLVPSDKSSSSNSAMTSDGPSSRSYLSNLTNTLLLPPTSKPLLHFDYEPSEVPPVVEVIVAGNRMRYPSECIFTTSRVVDLYRSYNHLTPSPRSNLQSVGKRPGKNHQLNKNSKILHPLLPESDKKPTLAAPNFTNPATNVNEPIKEKSSDSESNNSYATPNAQTTISRYNSNRLGFGGSNAPLGPTDLVKLFPTPPSLEQIIQSPMTEETHATKEPIPSPANAQLVASEHAKDNGIDVYKPVECAVMPPPPKWAALTNIIVSSSKLLPPECIYKGSAHKTGGKNIIRGPNSSLKGSSINALVNARNNNRNLSYLLEKSKSSPIPPSPLTDQTNRNGFNLNPSTPKNLTHTSLLSSTSVVSMSSPFSPSPIISSSVAPEATATNNLSTFSAAYTLPHQKLFNNLNEINSIQLNLFISDSVLGTFQDHNFENCTLCVCNMSIKDDTIPQKVDIGHQWKHSSASGANEPLNECTCGFSAMTNRHYSHISGLFLEDELEITNILYDPTEMIDQNKLFRKSRLSTYSEASLNDEQKLWARKSAAKSTESSSNKNPGIKLERGIKEEKSSQNMSQDTLDDTKILVIDQLKQQCSTSIHTNSSLAKILMIESFRNNKYLTSCSNYYAQASTRSGIPSNPFPKFLDETNKFTTIKLYNKNPNSLQFSDYCEFIKSLVTKLGNQTQQSARLTTNLVKSHQGSCATSSNLITIFNKMFSPARHSLMGKSIDSHGGSRNSIFAQGLQSLVLPTLMIDAKGALQMLEQLMKEESKEALATLNKAILIFSSPIHDWQFITTPMPQKNFDVVNLLKIIQPQLDEAVGRHNRNYKDFVHQQQQNLFSARDSPSGAPVQPTPPCQGPLTWRQFHQAAGRGTEDQCEPQPIPSLLVSHQVDNNHIAVSPFALKFWDKLLLEPFAPVHNMFYLVIAPDNQNIIGQSNSFFKELSNTYELLKLGKHTPISSGLVVVSNNNSENDKSSEDDANWFPKSNSDEANMSIETMEMKLKWIESHINPNLAKMISEFIEDRQPPHDPHADRFEPSPSPNDAKALANYQARKASQLHQGLASKSSNIPSGPAAPTQSSGGSCHPIFQQQQSGLDHGENPTAVPGEFHVSRAQSLLNAAGHGSNEDNMYMEDEATKQYGIVIYMIDPFSSPTLSQNHRTVAIIGLIKCYYMLVKLLPENLRRIIQLQLISLESITHHSRPLCNLSRVDQLKALSMNVYSRCRKILTNPMTAKSLTGFGPASALDTFFKTKDPELCVSKMYTPPFILAPMKDKQTELGEMFGDRREKSSVLFCSYCITEDQRWLLTTVTNERGDMSESTVISINIIDRMKRPRASVRRAAFGKMMEFFVSVMSDWVNPWRLIIGKLGRIGHGELKDWATLLSKRSLLNFSRHLTERCRQCSVLPSTETVSILSACLVSLEPDSKLRIMPDQFTSDDRQASFNKCPLNTPEDASTTHILVFPTSASIQATHENVEDPLVGSGLDDDLLNQFPLDDGMEDLGGEDNINDLFMAWDEPNSANVTDPISSHHDTMMSSNNLQLGSVSGGEASSNQDETLQLLQQPLALGYYISTAKIGQMPNWFWSTSAHLRNSCPVFLKSALHIHMPCVQLSDDLLHSGVGQMRKSHQLDSNLTTDVLRHVLEGYNSLSWLSLNPRTYDRQSCLPVHMQNLLQLYHLMESFS